MYIICTFYYCFYLRHFWSVHGIMNTAGLGQSKCGVDIGLPIWRVCGRGLNRSVHEGMNDISNVKVHLRTRSGNVNIYNYKREVLNCL